MQPVAGERVEVLEHLVAGELREARRKGPIDAFEIRGIGRGRLQDRKQRLGLGDRVAQLRQPVAQQGDAVLRVGERRVDLVRDPRDQLAQRRHLLGLHQLRLGFLQAAHGGFELARALGDPLLQGFVGLAQLRLGGDDARSEVAHAEQERGGVDEEVYAPAVLLVERRLDGFRERARQQLNPAAHGEEGELAPRFGLGGAGGEELPGGGLGAAGGGGGLRVGRCRGHQRRKARFDLALDFGLGFDVGVADRGAHLLDLGHERECRVGAAGARRRGRKEQRRVVFASSLERFHGAAVCGAQRAEGGFLLRHPRPQRRDLRAHGRATRAVLELVENAPDDDAAVRHRRRRRGEIVGDAQSVKVPAGVHVAQFAQQRESLGVFLEARRQGFHEQECERAQEESRGEDDIDGFADAAGTHDEIVLVIGALRL